MIDKHATHNLIILNDDVHTYQHFANAIKTVFPSLTDKAIRCMCLLANKAGSAPCAHGCIERLEMARLALEKFGIDCVIERRTT